MKVHELIKLLEKCPPDLEVCSIPGDDGPYIHPNVVDIKTDRSYGEYLLLGEE